MRSLFMFAFRGIAFFAILLFAVPSLPASQFRTATAYKAGAWARAAAVGDFNHDGYQDVVVVNSEEAKPNINTINILLNKRNGTFGPPTSYALINRATGTVAVADFNGDGNLDIAVCTTVGVDIFLGNGNGTFQSAYAEGTSLYPVQAVPGDFNNDGIQDLIVTANNFEVQLMLGNGDGSFQSPVQVGAWINFTYVMPVGDFNHDGKLDFAVLDVDLPSYLNVYLGNGDGTFQSPISNYVGTDGLAALTADFNGDGILDLAVLENQNYGNDPGEVTVLLGNGDGTFQAGITTTTATDNGPGDFAALDLDGDGKMDLVVSNSGSDDVSILFGRGDGTFQFAHNWAAGPAPSAVVVADFNLDGVPDVLAVSDSSSNNSVNVLTGGRGGSLTAARDFDSGLGFFINTADFNEDGIPDLVVSQYYANFQVLLGLGRGVFGKPTTNGMETTIGPAAIADLNGDGHLDLVFPDTCCLNEVSVVMGNGDGTFQRQVNYVVGTSPENVIIADFDRDGILDLAVNNEGQGLYGSVSLLLGNGDGTFQKATTPISLFNGFYSPFWMVSGDFNGDGKLDLAFAVVTGDYIGSVIVVLGNGDGTFQTPMPAIATGTSTFYLAAADLNHDGKLDLVATSAGSTTNNVSVLIGNGDGTFQIPVNYTDGTSPIRVSIVDYDGDGNLDLAILTKGNSGISFVDLRHGRGDGTFESPSAYPTGLRSIDMVSADYNSNGSPDLAVLNEGGGNTTILLNTAP